MSGLKDKSTPIILGVTSRIAHSREKSKQQHCEVMSFWTKLATHLRTNQKHFQPAADSPVAWAICRRGPHRTPSFSATAAVSDSVHANNLCNPFCHMFGSTTVRHFFFAYRKVILKFMAEGNSRNTFFSRHCSNIRGKGAGYGSSGIHFVACYHIRCQSSSSAADSKVIFHFLDEKVVDKQISYHSKQSK